MLPRRSRKLIGKKRETHPGMMRWLLTYADLITLLMAFFVILFAVSNADAKKFDSLKQVLHVSFHSQRAGGENMITDFKGKVPVGEEDAIVSRETADFHVMIEKIREASQDSRQLSYQIDERGLTIRFMDSILFDRGQANLRTDAMKLLDAVGGVLKGGQQYIRVEGHTDDLPIATAEAPSNWHLSANRAIAVTRFLIERHQLNPERLSSLGYGEYRPLYSNTTEENRARNRRVDIVILRGDHSGGEIGSRPTPGNP